MRKSGVRIRTFPPLSFFSLLYLVLEHNFGDDLLWCFVEDIAKSTAVRTWEMSNFVTHVLGRIWVPLRKPEVSFNCCAVFPYILSDHPPYMVAGKSFFCSKDVYKKNE